MAAVQPQQHAAVLDDAEGWYRLIAETIPLMVWSARADGGVDYVNQRVLDYTGLDARAVQGWNWEQIIHPEDRARCAAVWRQALESGELSENAMRLRRADGEYHWHQGSGVALRDADGRIVRWLGICADLEADERLRTMRAAQARLRESEQRFQTFMDNLPANAWIRDAQFRYSYVNRRYAETWADGDPATLVGRSAAELFPPEVTGYFRDSDRKVRAQGAATQYVDSEPSGRWLKVKFPVPDGHGGVGVGGIAVDITERSRLEEALAESERRFRSFMDHAPALAWIKDGALRYTYVNPAWERVFQRRAEEMLGRDGFDLWPQVAEYFRSDDEAVLRDGEAVQKVRHFSLDGGAPRHWMVVKFPMADGRGGTGLAGMAIDLTPRVEAEAKAQRYADDARDLASRLVQAQEAERRRVADELHDLIGQNLSALGIDLQALKQRLQAGGDTIAAPRLDAMATLLDTTIDAIRGVMTDLRPVALEEFGLVPALRWYASQFSERTGMKVRTNAPRRETRLPRDTEVALFRIVQEALTNAAKHSGGSTVEITVAHADSSVRLSIEDDGRGFPKSARKRASDGGGFGLPTMRERAEAVGGSLRVEFPERGTRVVVEAPVATHDD